MQPRFSMNKRVHVAGVYELCGRAYGAFLARTTTSGMQMARAVYMRHATRPDGQMAPGPEDADADPSARGGLQYQWQQQVPVVVVMPLRVCRRRRGIEAEVSIVGDACALSIMVPQCRTCCRV